MTRETLSRRYSPFFTFCAAVMWMSVVVSLPGCGKKAPPLPPHSDPVPPVTDLSHELKGSRVVLSWSVPDEVKRGAFGEGEMLLFRATTKLTDEICPDCPLVYQRIAAMPISLANGGPNPIYEEELQQGFRFTYKVVLHMDSGRSSEASNLVVFDYQGPDR